MCQLKKLESKESWMESTKLKPKHEENCEGENFSNRVKRKEDKCERFGWSVRRLVLWGKMTEGGE